MTLREEFLEELADRIVSVESEHPLRVAIDGVDGAGKTTLADELVDPITELERPVVRVSIDDFHHPAEIRYRQGKQSPEGYYEDSFDLAAVQRQVLGPLGPGGSRQITRKAFDYRSDRPVSSEALEVAPNTILLFDGIFLQRPELVDDFDLVIFLEVSFDETVARMVARDGADPDVEAESNRRYVGGQRLYLERCEPRHNADILVDNEDVEEPQIVWDNFT